MKVHKMIRKWGGGAYKAAASLLVAGILSLGSNADTMIVTQKVDGVDWQLKIDTEAKTASVGPNNASDGSWPNVDDYESSRAIAHPSSIARYVYDAMLIPSSFEIEGETYTVTEIGMRSFIRSRMKSLLIPEAVEHVWNVAFYGCPVRDVCIKGPPTAKKGRTQEYVSFARENTAFQTLSNLQFAVIGPNVKAASAPDRFFYDAANATVLLPRRSDNMTWNDYGESKTIGVGNGNTVVFYGSGEDFDMTMGEKSVTVFPTTAATLAGALEWAPTFKKGFGLDVYVSINNAITGIESVPALSGGVSSDTLSWVTFVVSNQTQLNNTLAAVQSAGTLSIDASGAKENIVVPEGRSVAVTATTAETYSPNRRELVISKSK